MFFVRVSALGRRCRLTFWYLDVQDSLEQTVDFSDFTTAAAHEIGHALGFFSQTERRPTEPEGSPQFVPTVGGVTNLNFNLSGLQVRQAVGFARFELPISNEDPTLSGLPYPDQEMNLFFPLSGPPLSAIFFVPRVGSLSPLSVNLLSARDSVSRPRLADFRFYLRSLNILSGSRFSKRPATQRKNVRASGEPFRREKKEGHRCPRERA
jgi:hypothetical protein